MTLFPYTISRTFRRLALAGGGLTLLSGSAAPANAHHSFGQFEMRKDVTVEGTVRTFQWTNPHIWIDVLVNDSARKQVVPLSIEGDAVAIMQRKGWTRSSIKPGDKVTITYHPLKSGAPGGALASASIKGVDIGHAADFRN